VELYEGGWMYDGQACDRLWNKSAIGRPMEGRSLLLTPAEVIFCHDHRHVDWPSANWLQEAVGDSPRLLDEAVVVESLRVPGNKLVIHQNFDALELVYADSTWGLRWTSDGHPRSSAPVSEVRWFHASEHLDVDDLYAWSERVSSKGRIPEILVVDDEHAVVTYRVARAEPEGIMGEYTETDLEYIAGLSGSPLDNGGKFIVDSDNWPEERIGVPHPGGRVLDASTNQMIDSHNDAGRDTLGADILRDLLRRGLHPRPGFKYGTRWRCYDRTIGESHAPWLVIHPAEAPHDWRGACLASRLASGVGKTWLHPLQIDGVWSYLSITRPPADSRWNNPNRR
jgi:hypothetical protein